MKKKLVFGKGVNDSPRGSCYYRDESGKKKANKFYSIWRNMFERCYSEKVHKGYPSYIGCSVSEEWYSLSEFKLWFDQTYVEGFQLDKDLLVTDNQIYSPETCSWLPQELNSFLINKRVNQGGYPTGVCYNKQCKKPSAQIRINSEAKHLGYFETVEEAHLAYAASKQQHLITLLQRYAGGLDIRVIRRLEEMISMPIEQFKNEFC